MPRELPAALAITDPCVLWHFLFAVAQDAGTDTLVKNLLDDPGCSTPTSDLVSDSDPATRTGVASSKALDDLMVRTLAQDPSVDVRLALAGNGWDVDLGSGAGLLAHDPSDEVRQLLARRATLPVEVVAILAADEVAGVRASIAKRPNLADEVVARLAIDGSAIVRAALASSSPSAAALLVDDPEETVRRSLASNRTSSEIAERLAADESALVRQSAAELCDRLGSSTISRLAQDAAPGVRAALYRYRCHAASNFRLAAEDPEPLVRASVARNRTVGQESTGRLAQDPCPEVRAAVAESWSAVPAEVIEQLARDADEVVRAAVARRDGDLPRGVESTLARDPDSGVRFWLAQRVDLSVEAIAILVEDDDVDVRGSLADGHLDSLSAGVIEKLLTDASDTNRAMALATYGHRVDSTVLEQLGLQPPAGRARKTIFREMRDDVRDVVPASVHWRPAVLGWSDRCGLATPAGLEVAQRMVEILDNNRALTLAELVTRAHAGSPPGN